MEEGTDHEEGRREQEIPAHQSDAEQSEELQASTNPDDHPIPEEQLTEVTLDEVSTPKATPTSLPEEAEAENEISKDEGPAAGTPDPPPKDTPKVKESPLPALPERFESTSEVPISSGVNGASEEEEDKGVVVNGNVSQVTEGSSSSAAPEGDGKMSRSSTTTTPSSTVPPSVTTSPSRQTTPNTSIRPSARVAGSRESLPASLHRRTSTTSTHPYRNSAQAGSIISGGSVLIISSIESIYNTREGKRAGPLRDACAKALEMLRGASGSTQSGRPSIASVQEAPAPTVTGSDGTEIDPRVIFEPLRLACETGSEKLVVSALDCIGKLVSYGFFIEPELAYGNFGGGGGGEERVGEETGKDGTDAEEVENDAERENGPIPSGMTAADSEADGKPDVPPSVPVIVAPTPSTPSASSSQPQDSNAKDRPSLPIPPRTPAADSDLDIGDASASTSGLRRFGTLTEEGALTPIGENGPSAGQVQSLADLATSTICSTFTESAAPSIHLQILKSLLAIILSSSPTTITTSSATPGTVTPNSSSATRLAQQASTPTRTIQPPQFTIHQSSLLRAVRTVYNVFLTSKSPPNQAVAQGTLVQIVGSVFGRVQVGGDPFGVVHVQSRNSLGSVPESVGRPNAGVGAGDGGGDDGGEEAGVDDEGRQDGNTETHAVTNGHDDGEVGQAAEDRRASFDRPNGGMYGSRLTLNDLFIKDAYLVFRSMCKLSMKPLGSDSERDLKSHSMRSKLLSLHLIHSILNSHMQMIVDPSVILRSSTTHDSMPFVQAIKQYLCLSLSRNAISPVLAVFELSCEIFWRMISGMRTKLKKEIEVLLNEIFLPIMEMRTSTIRQKSLLLGIFTRLCHDPQALVEIYLNYDCDRTSLDNVYERLMNIISKISTTKFETSTAPSGPDAVNSPASASVANFSPTGGPMIPPSLNTSALAHATASDSSLAWSHLPVEERLKRQSLECLVFVLKSLVNWAGKGSHPSASAPAALPATDAASVYSGEGADASTVSVSNGTPVRQSSELQRAEPSDGASTPNISTPEPLDDPNRFANAKQRKTTLLEGIKKFNYKPKKASSGIEFLVETGFIKSRAPKDIARFLLHADGLSKAAIGEFLGGSSEDQIATMHAFVDMLEFRNTHFLDALRLFLQSFRLPGEAQVIDRFLLKFAARYMAGNPESMFVNADTPYVFAYSVVMLNTDLHNPQVKKRMTTEEFIKNNSKLNDGKDLPEDFLRQVYDSIQANEIRMKGEVPTASGGSGLASTLANVGRDMQREAYVLESEGMANKTEALFRSLARNQRTRSGHPSQPQFYSATHVQHVRPMFSVVWMPLLAGISAPLQESDDMDIVSLSLEGFKQAIKIACLFDLELERNAFVTTIANFTFLNNLGEMKPKNVEAIKALLDIAAINGNYLKKSWKEVHVCISQLERFELITAGVDSRSVPELGRNPNSAGQSGRGAQSRNQRQNRPTEEVAQETRSSQITLAAARIFESSSTLSGTAIVDFVQALSEVSTEEIQASGLSEQPRTFCLQKLVEISYYNMNRIRIEWSNIWRILGEHFNQVCCHTSVNVSFFALDSLRQLSMRFLEKEELSNFKFQQDFLKPFEHAMIHNARPDVQDMVLQCLDQMLKARVQNLRSGWRTMFGVFSAASKVLTERVATLAFEIVQRVNTEHFSRVIVYGSFADLAVCITDFCKISKFQRLSLQGIEMLRALIPQMLSCPECPLSHAVPVQAETELKVPTDVMMKYWFPVLFAFYDVIMNGEDLEVRKRALDYLFETLKTHGQSFPPEFWDLVCKEVLFPIFSVLRSRSDVSRFSTQEDMSVWLSTTMISALRNLIDLFSFYFDALGRMLDRLLDLLCECICQENDTLARIGTACLQQLLEKNVRKLNPERWEKIISTFIHLFKTTTATQLFDERLLAPQRPEEMEPSPALPNGFVPPTPLSPGLAADDSQPPLDSPSKPERPALPDRRRIFRQIIVKCVLQLLLIETTHELLQKDAIYTTIPPQELLRLMAVLDNSYRFAKKFNMDARLRSGLHRAGFMKQPPNLLRQESSSAATLVSVLLRMYNDDRPDHVANRQSTVDAFAPLGLDVISGFVSLDSESQMRNIAAWTPVAVEVLQGFCSFNDDFFEAHLPTLYPLACDILSREMSPEIRESVRLVFVRTGAIYLSNQPGFAEGDPGQNVSEEQLTELHVVNGDEAVTGDVAAEELA